MKLIFLSLAFLSVTRAQAPPLYTLKVTVQHDNWPTETGWSLTSHPDGETYLYQMPGSVQVQGQNVVRTTQLPPGDYHFEITDASSDGICCGFGQGWYEVELLGSQTVHRSGQFYAQETWDFRIEQNGAMDMPVPQGGYGGGGYGGGGSQKAKIDYYLQVYYGYREPWETEVKIQLMDPRTELELWPAGSQPPNNFRMERLTNLMYGHQHRLVLTDLSENGMPGGWAEVAMYVNDKWCQDLVVINGDDHLFKKKRRVVFDVPTEADAIRRCCQSTGAC